MAGHCRMNISSSGGELKLYLKGKRNTGRLRCIIRLRKLCQDNRITVNLFTFVIADDLTVVSGMLFRSQFFIFRKTKFCGQSSAIDFMPNPLQRATEKLTRPEQPISTLTDSVSGQIVFEITFEGKVLRVLNVSKQHRTILEIFL